MREIALLSVALAFLLLVACGGDDIVIPPIEIPSSGMPDVPDFDPDDFGFDVSFSGTVTSSVDGTPISGVAVSLSDLLLTYTLDDGTYELSFSTHLGLCPYGPDPWYLRASCTESPDCSGDWEDSEVAFTWCGHHDIDFVLAPRAEE